MEVWAGLIGVVMGAAVTFAGQYLMSRAELSAAHRSMVLDHCVQLIALSHDFRNRLWEERHIGVSGTVEQRDLSAYRHAEAALRLLAADDQLIDALDHLRDTGQELGSYWRLEGLDVDDGEIDHRWTAHREAIGSFTNVAGLQLASI